MIDLKAIKERESAASPGPWVDNTDVYDESSCGGGGFRKYEDEEFALHARADIPALIARVEEMEMDILHVEAYLEYAGRITADILKIQQDREDNLSMVAKPHGP